jgi:hypothetical protein
LRHARMRTESWNATLAARVYEVGRGAASEALISIAEALEAGRWRADDDPIRSRLDRAAAALGEEVERSRAAADEARAEELEEVQRLATSVRAYLRGAVDLAVSW